MPFTVGLSAAERKTIDEEIQRLRAQLDTSAMVEDVPERKDHTNMLVGATILLAVVAVIAIVIIFVARPDKDNSTLVGTLLGFLVPLMTALLAAAVQQVHLAVNSRLTQLLRVTAAKSKAEGMLLARQQALTDPPADEPVPAPRTGPHSLPSSREGQG